jgi:hypothetical protein
VPDRLDAEVDQVGGTRPFHDGEYLRRPLHKGADTECDRDHLRVFAHLVSGDGEQRGSPAGGRARLTVNSTLGPGMAMSTVTTAANASMWLVGAMASSYGGERR